MDDKTRRHPTYPITYGIFHTATCKFWNGYLYDLELKVPPKRWNLHETHEREAWKRVAEMVEQIYGNGQTLATATKRIKRESVESVLTKWLEDEFIPDQKVSGRPEHRQKTLISNRRRVIKRICEKIGTMSPISLDRDVINTYIRDRLKESAMGTVKLEIELLKRALRVVLRERGEAILHKIKGHKVLKNAPERETIIDPEEFARIKEAIPVDNPCRFAFHLQNFCGMRTNEVRELLWDNYERDKQRLHLFAWQVKEKKDRYPYLGQYEVECLDMLWAKERKGPDGKPISKYVFHGINGAETISLDSYYHTWTEACRKCGFVDEKRIMKDGKPAPKFRLHDNRRSRVSIMMDSGVNLKDIQAMVGHSAVSMTLKYAQTKEAARLDLANRMEEIDRKYSEAHRALNGKIEKTLKRSDEVVNGVDTWDGRVPELPPEEVPESPAAKHPASVDWMI